MIAACPKCQARYRVDTSRLKGGKGRLKCAKCGEVFPVQAEEPAAEAPAPAAPAAPPSGAPSVARLLEASRGAPAGKLAVAIVGCEPGPLRSPGPPGPWISGRWPQDPSPPGPPRGAGRAPPAVLAFGAPCPCAPRPFA